MKAVRIHSYGGPEVLIHEDVEPPQAAEGRVLVRVKAAAVNPVDVAIREHRFPTPLEPPRIIGSDGAGVVEEVGPGVEGVSPGDEVVFTGLGVGTQGSYAELTTIAAVQAVPKPSSVSFEEAAAMGLVFPTALYGLDRRAHLREGETVLVQGAAGGIGSAAVQLARAMGAGVIGVVSSAADADRVRSLGAQSAVDRHHSDVAEEARRLTDDRGVDVVLEIATTENMATDLAAIAKGGRIVCIGQGPGDDVAVPVARAVALDATILFASSSNAGRAGMAQMLREVGELVERGAVQPVVGATLPLAEARRAHEMLAGHHFGKIVLVP